MTEVMFLAIFIVWVIGVISGWLIRDTFVGIVVTKITWRNKTIWERKNGR